MSVRNNNASVPEGWRRARLRDVVSFRNGAAYDDVEVDEPGYPVYGSGGQFRWADSWLYDGASVLFGRKGTVDRPLYVEGRFWTVDTMYFTVPRADLICPRFLYYWATRVPFDYYSTGSALPSMTQSDLGQEPLMLPPLTTQRQIADYLDHETAEIDAFIADLDTSRRLSSERLLSLLWELTNPHDGVDGVEQPLGTLASFTAGGTPDSNKVDYWSNNDTGVPWVAISDMSRREVVHSTAKRVTSRGMAAAGLRLLKPGTVLLAMYASVGEVAKLEVPAVTNQAILGIAPTRDLNADFLFAHLRSRQSALLSEARSNTQANLNANQVRHLKLWCPSREVQDLIVSRIDAQLAKHRAQVADIDAAITLAKERRAALITAAVTGQIDVTTTQKPAVDGIQTAIEESR